MRASWVLCFLILAAFSSIAFAKKAIIDRPDRTNFRCCYLTPEDASQCNYAIIYKGLEVDVIGGSKETRYKVRVPLGNNKVVVADGWSGRPDPEGVGWVASRFIQIQETQSADDGQSSGNVGLLDISSGTVGSSDFTSTLPTIQNDATSVAGVNNPVEDINVDNIVGTASNDEGIYYIFAGMGEDQEYFFNLVQNGGTAGRSNHVWKYIRRDIKETSKKCVGIVVVKVDRAKDMYDILRQGMVPEDGPTPLDIKGGRFPIYAFSELKKSKHKIMGFATVSHSGQDGPLVGYANNRGMQFSTELVKTDYNLATIAPEADYFMFNRMLDNPRFTFCGCNIGHCQYYDMEDESFGHGVAAVYNTKGAVVRAKWSTGAVNATEKHFATYGKDDEGIVRRLTPHKKDYRMLVSVPNNRYDTFNVPYSSQEEKEAILAYYKERDITVRVYSRYIRVRSPSWLRGKWLNYAADKDNLLEAVINAMATRGGPKAYEDEDFAKWLKEAKVTPEIEEVQKMMPRLKKLTSDPLLQYAIEKSKQANNGVFDIHDYRVWLVIYYGDKTAEELREIRSVVPLRACICCDEELTKAFK